RTGSVPFVLPAARRLVLIFVNPLYNGFGRKNGLKPFRAFRPFVRWGKCRQKGRKGLQTA
ncbi:hypothetical protein, partial [Neisseria gonorrhoeae]|uniref:hypothetical protein n=1 Tax=Neisseria gonorrhoeae TaxID=485 RepID=UPI001E4B2A43